MSCHLGNGASLAAIRDGRSIDTTMGFTPLEGLMMGTRSGSIDPGILIYLVRHKGYDAAQLDRLLNRESGLKGISGISGDMREILAAIERGEARARLAFDMYVHRLCREIGGMVASLGGVDALLFTAGIGENCPPLADGCLPAAFVLEHPVGRGEERTDAGGCGHRRARVGGAGAGGAHRRGLGDRAGVRPPAELGCGAGLQPAEGFSPTSHK